MFQAPPREGPVRSWFLFGAWSVLIFCTIPLARPILRALGARGAADFLRWLALAVIVASALLAVWYAVRRLRGLPWPRVAWLTAVVGVFAYLTTERMQTPGEAIHFVEYGFLGLLAFRALSHRLRDALVYPSAVLLCLLVGTTDEIIQWATPGRYWDVRDIVHNGLAALMAQIALAGGLRPPFIRPGISPLSVRWCCGLTALLLVLLGLCASNTPVAVDRYSDRLPFLKFLRQQDAAMSEYGFRHEDPEIGRFYSRFDLDDLAYLDHVRGEDAGRVIAHYVASQPYAEFLRRYTPATDPFLHEAMVHLYRRNHYRDVSVKYTADPALYARHVTVAYRENQILERYFSNTLTQAGQRWPDGEAARLEPHLRADRRYRSEVSRHLIFRVAERDIWHLIAALLAVDVMILLWLGRSRREGLP